ncbi:hypothetical protein M378DRAFT_786654 [Amanita muscaria Koide BX008]|uniref:Uncharacterized protein n=1 Tax=Amanita muscaria (strain Koide BX008) TaxID=946122 RepID=A0A0C2XK60_AMAMK|nr:hypothetical protein M378DRAFT_786654 [Amanita muscaria Koide BX008]
MVSYAQTTTIATAAHAILFGVYIATFFLCCRWLLFTDDGWSKRKDIKWSMLIVTFVIFALSTVDFAMSLRTTLSSLSSSAEGLHPESTISIAVESLTAVIIDGVLIFRCWIVYDKSWRVVAGFLFPLLYNIASLIVFTYWGSIELKTMTTIFHVQIVRLHEVFLISTILINVCATSAIIWQIWKNCISPHLLRFATRIVADSGLLYTFTSLLLLCTISVDNAAQGLELPRMLASAICYPVAGIAYNLILIRAAQYRDNDPIERLPSLEFITPVDTNTDYELTPQPSRV